MKIENGYYRIYPCNIYHIDEVELKIDRYKDGVYQLIINYGNSEAIFLSNESINHIYVYNNKAIKIMALQNDLSVSFVDDVWSNGIIVDMFDSTFKYRYVNQVDISLESVLREVNGNILPANQDYCITSTNGYADKFIYNFKINMNSLITDIAIDDLEEHEIYSYLKIKNISNNSTCPRLKVFIK